MNRAEKSEQIAVLEEKIAQFTYIYVADPAGMKVAQVNRLRELCFQNDIEYRVFKNTLIRKALARQQDAAVYESFPAETFQGSTALLFTQASGATIAKLLVGFHKELDIDIPRFKAACLDQEVYQNTTLDALSKLKGKTELIAEVLALLQSPLHTTLGQLQAPQKVMSLLNALEQKQS